MSATRHIPSFTFQRRKLLDTKRKTPTFPIVVTVVALAAALVAAGCSPSTNTELTDAQIVWCEANPVNVAGAAEALEVPGYETIDPRIIVSPTDKVIYAGRLPLPQWATRYPDSYNRACQATYEAATSTNQN